MLLLYIIGQGFPTRVLLIVTSILIMFMVTVQILVEAFQLSTQGLEYFRDWTNYVNMGMCICSLIFSSSILHECVCPTPWQWQLGCIAVFLAWIDFLIFLRMIPGGKYNV